jgi:hypothetical protein
MSNKQQITFHTSLLIKLWVLASFSLIPNVGWSESPLKKAQRLAFDAQISAEKSDFKQSIRLYQKAYELYPDQEFLFAVASLYKRVSDSCKEELESWDLFFSHCKSCSLLGSATERVTESRARCQSSVTVTCQPSALVFVNGRVKGSSPQTIQSLNPGSYKIQCDDGKQSVTQSIQLSHGQHKKFSLKQKKPQNRPFNSSQPSKRPILKKIALPSTEAQPQFTALEWSLTTGGIATLGLGMYLLLHQLPTKLEQRDAQEGSLINSGLLIDQDQLSRARELDQQAQSAETWGLISLGTSTALLGSVLYMLWPELALFAQVHYVPTENTRVSLQWSW